MIKKKSFYLHTLGCAKNEFDSSLVKRKLIEKGYTQADSIEDADFVILNTCSFIEDAVKETFDTAADLLKRKNKKAKFIFAGCAVNYFKERIVEALPADLYLSTDSFLRLPELLKNDVLGFVPFKDREALYSDDYKIFADEKLWAYLKVAEGCSNHCSYCLIPKIRGPIKSVPIELIVKEALRLADAGKRELNLIAQDLSSYGLDLNDGSNLYKLVKTLSQELSSTDVWIRLLYINPDKVDFSLLLQIFSIDKVLPYLEVPIQSGSEAVLKRMNRKRAPNEILRGIDKLRSKFPELTVRTTFLAGFPGETEEDFMASYKFLLELKPDYAYVFPYSDMEGTKSFLMDGKLNQNEIMRRKNELSEAAYRIMEEKAAEKEGKIVEVLIEETANGAAKGRAYFQAPEIDGFIRLKLSRRKIIKPGARLKVKIIKSEGIDFEGEVI